MNKHLFENYRVPSYLKHHRYILNDSSNRTYCGVYPLSRDFKTFSFSTALSKVGTKCEEEGIRLHVIHVFFYFLFKISKEIFEKTKLLT